MISPRQLKLSQRGPVSSSTAFIRKGGSIAILVVTPLEVLFLQEGLKSTLSRLRKVAIIYTTKTGSGVGRVVISWHVRHS
jgi:hypothetical protein